MPKQVKIWIEVKPFSNEFVYDFITDEVSCVLSQAEFKLEALNAILSRTEVVMGKTYIKQDESRDSIIEELYKQQQKILPDNVEIMPLLKGMHIFIRHSKLITFYNPATRIITITDFREVNHV